MQPDRNDTTVSAKVPTRDPESLLRAFNERINRPRADDLISDKRWSYRCAAAVLHCFRPKDLKPYDPSLGVDDPYVLLARDIVPASGGRMEGLQTLKPDVRKTSLHRLSTVDQMRAALNSNPARVRTDLQMMLEAWINGTATPIDHQSYGELRLSYQVSEWLDGLVPAIPALSTIQPIMARRSVLASVEHLVMSEFIGRLNELKQLRDYVGILPPSRTESVRRRVRKFFNLVERPPLVITGPGGIGKSALIGRFLYEHSNVAEEHHFPFAYLPFDNPSLKIDDPFTLLIEAAAQFELQYPQGVSTFQTFHEQVKSYRDIRGQIGDKTLVFSTVRARLEAVQTADQNLYRAFASLLRSLNGDDLEPTPALIVLDTFEEVEYRSPEQLKGLWEMLGDVLQSYPLLRVILSGRRVGKVVVNNQTAIPLPLPPLDSSSSERLLQQLGVSDPQVAMAVVKQVGGNPLTLRLAARVLESEEPATTGIANLNTRTWYLATLSEGIIRGQLYRRILDHIHDENVRKLAHPGMILRRLTPALIQDVLSPICDVPVSNVQTAQFLFDEVRKEHTLVFLHEDGSLHYRPEIRASMLRLMTQDKPQQTRAIHEAAVSYYARVETPDARAEELYHRLMLNQDSSVLLLRWLDAAGTSIASSLDDLPPRAAAWLASRMSLNISKEIRENADTEEWERHVARSVRDATRYLDWKTALAVLSERKERSPGSPLFALEARAHLLARDNLSAARVLDDGIASMPFNPNRGRYVELLWMRAGVAENLTEIVDSDNYLERAQRTAESISNPLCLVQILTERLVIRERWPNVSLSDSSPLRDRLAETLSATNEALVDQERGLVRNAIGFLGSAYPVTFGKMLASVGLGVITREQLNELLLNLSPMVPSVLPLDSSNAPDVTALSLMDRTNMDVHLLDGIASLLRHTIGTGSTPIVGIEEYREPWELETSADVR